jgi:hypothetical protein
MNVLKIVAVHAPPARLVGDEPGHDFPVGSGPDSHDNGTPAPLRFLVKRQATARKEKGMNYYADFDPYLIKERNEGLLREASTWRLEKRLRRSRGRRGSRLGAIARTVALPLFRRVRLSEQQLGK